MFGRMMPTEADLKIPALMVAIDELPPDGLDLELDIPAREAAALVSAEGQEVPALASGLTGRLAVRNLGRRLSLKGSFQVEAEIPCDRCLADAKTTLCGRVDELVNLVYPGESATAAEEDEADGSLAVVDGRVDLSGLMAEFFWLAWPFRFICRPECAGLCPRCGADLNDGLCGCDKLAEN